MKENTFSPCDFFSLAALSFCKYMRTAKRLNRVDYVCPSCQQPGVIRAAWVALTEVRLEGDCPDCGVAAVRSFDLLESDQWLMAA